MRAPISMSMAARSICLDSFRTLLAGVDMAGSRVLQADQRTSETRLAIRMLACSVLVAPLPILLLLWLRDAPSQEPPATFGEAQALAAAQALREAAVALETRVQLHEAAAALVRAREAAVAWPGAADMLAPIDRKSVV